MGQEDLPESLGRRLLPGNGQKTIVGRFFDIVCQFSCPWTFSRAKADRQHVLVNVDAIDHLCYCAVACYGRGGHPGLVSETLVEGFKDDVLDISCRHADPTLAVFASPCRHGSET